MKTHFSNTVSSFSGIIWLSEKKEEYRMKREFFSCPEQLQPEVFGFSWLEYVLAIPSPLVLVTSYKENGLPNAAMQSWCTVTGNEGYHCLFSGVHKAEHMYSSVLATKHLVVNFP